MKNKLFNKNYIVPYFYVTKGREKRFLKFEFSVFKKLLFQKYVETITAYKWINLYKSINKIL